MASGYREEVLVVDGMVSSYSSSSMCQCRICHEEEEERYSSMESPCSCSGSLKFAHRGCIQRWCDEKGSTICEICLQNFEPGYTVPTKKALVDVPVTIRDSLEVSRLNHESRSRRQGAAAISDEGTDYAVCSPDSERSSSCCRLVAVTFTILLLLRHLIAVLSVGPNHHAFTLVTVFVLRASGILLPFYLVMILIKAIHSGQRRRQQFHVSLDEVQVHLATDDSSNYGEEEDDELQEHIIEIHA